MNRDMEVSKREKASKVDMISNMPDPILHLILSGLPTTEEAIRTSILSTRWRYLWTSVSSLNIDIFRGSTSIREFRKNKFEEFVNGIFANKSTDLDSFRFCCGFNCDMSTVGRWIEEAVRRKVKLLNLKFSLHNEYEDIELPHSLVTCSSLEVLKLSLFACRLSVPKFTGFPALRVLKLKSCKLFNHNSIKSFLKSCPLLEDLSLVDCMIYDLDLLCISCSKLKTLRIVNKDIDDFEDSEDGFEGTCHHLQICCPKLMFLEFAGFMAFQFKLERHDSLKKVVIHPLDTYEWVDENVCESFSGFFHVESLSLHMCLIYKGIDLEVFKEPLPNLKTLEMTTTIDAFNINVLILILTCSPNLESLHLIIKKGSLKFPRDRDDLEFLEMDYECIFEKLKIVKMSGVSAVPQHMGFIEFLLASSPVLETMIITPRVKMTTDIKLFFSIELLGFRRASTEAEILFVQDQV